MKHFILFLFLCLFFLTNAWSQWERIPNFDIICNDAVLCDSGLIWGAGNIGKTIRYDYLNSKFSFKQFNDSLDFNTIYPLNDSILIFGGKIWSQSIGFLLFYNINDDSIVDMKSLPRQIWDIEFISPDSGFIVSSIGIHKTFNGGQTWEVIWDFSSIGADFGELYSMTTDPEGGIYASGRKRHKLIDSNSQGFVLKSVDQGDNWTIVYEIPDGYIDNLDYLFEQVVCHDKGLFSYYVSQNLGADWKKYDIPVSDLSLIISDITLLSKGHIFACISQYYFFETERDDHSTNMIINSPDNGLTWYIQYENHPPFPPQDTTFNNIIGINDSLIFCFGWNLALKTENQGGGNNPILGIDRGHISNNVHIYPLPASEFILVEGLFNIDRYSIYSITGRLLETKQIIQEKIITIPLVGLMPGSYVLVFLNESTFTLSKIFQID